MLNLLQYLIFPSVTTVHMLGMQFSA